MSNWKNDGLAKPVEAARLRTEKELGDINRAMDFRDRMKRSLSTAADAENICELRGEQRRGSSR